MDNAEMSQNIETSDSEMQSESETSVHSFEQRRIIIEKQVRYTTTNLIAQANLTLADIQIEQWTKAQIRTKVENLVRDQMWTRDYKICIDPRLQLKNEKQKGIVETLVDYEYVQALAQFATEMHLKHMQRSDRAQPQEGAVDIENLQRFSAQIVHDHLRNHQEEDKKSDRNDPVLIPLKIHKNSKRILKQKEKHKFLLAQIKYLRTVEEVPMITIAKRLKINYSRLRKICKNDVTDPEIAFQKRQKTDKFKKLHERARTRINYFLSREEQAVSLSDIQRDLKRTCQLHVNKMSLNNYLRSKLNVTYRQIKPIAAYQNNINAKLQRQYAAMYYIQMMSDSKRIINIDESVMRETDHRKRGWIVKGRHNQVTSTRRLSQVNIIAAISNLGEFYFTVNQGKTNSETFILFLTKLCYHLNSVDTQWRSKTVIMIDNAPYHRSISATQMIRDLKIPLMYLGPYQFKMAPIEMLFSYIKSFDLNPLRSKIATTQEFTLIIVVEQIHNMQRKWQCTQADFLCLVSKHALSTY